MGLNLIFAVGDNFLIWRITAELTKNQRLANVVLLLSFFFVPQLFMILFVYGINFGLFFVLLASLFLLRFLKTNQWGNMILSVIFFTIANTIRNNYIIFLLAVAIVVMIEFFKDKKFKKLLYIVLLFVSIKLTNTSITAYYQNVSGNACLTGEPKIAWIAMGLNDTPMYNRVGSWYDAFVENVYNENKGNSSKIEKASKLQLTKRISYMSSHLGYTANFFKNKFISTWTDSLFQSVWSGPISKLSVEGQRINGTIMKSIYNSGKLFKIIYRYSAVILIAIYLFATVGLVKLFVTSSLSSLALLPTIYLSGGLIFHLIWETKSQYVYPYVYVLIPLAGYGLFQIMNAQLMKTKR